MAYLKSRFLFRHLIPRYTQILLFFTMFYYFSSFATINFGVYPASICLSGGCYMSEEGSFFFITVFGALSIYSRTVNFVIRCHRIIFPKCG
jgi:hypothetical protein